MKEDELIKKLESFVPKEYDAPVHQSGLKKSLLQSVCQKSSSSNRAYYANSIFRRFVFVGIPVVSLLAILAITFSMINGNDTRALASGVVPRLEQTENEILVLQQQLSESVDINEKQQAQLDDNAARIEQLFEQRNQAWETIDNLQQSVDSLLGMLNPWPELNVYADPNSPVHLKAGEDFVIRYDLGNELFILSYNKIYDPSVVSFIEMKGAFKDAYSNSPGVSYLLFKAINSGNTQITISYEGNLGRGTVNPVTFDLIISA